MLIFNKSMCVNNVNPHTMVQEYVLANVAMHTLYPYNNSIHTYIIIYLFRLSCVHNNIIQEVLASSNRIVLCSYTMHNMHTTTRECE